MTKHESPPNFPWKTLGTGQVILFVLSLVAFMDMQSRVEEVTQKCGCLNNNVDYELQEEFEQIEEIEREKRSLKESLINMTDSTGKNQLWVHSLSKIQMDELLEKCLDVHQYCTNNKDETRGPPGPPVSLTSTSALLIVSIFMVHLVRLAIEALVDLLEDLESKACLVRKALLLGPPGPSGDEAKCIDCPITENYVLDESSSCPRVEQMRCPGDITFDGVGGPRGVINFALPSLVEFMLENETETDTCMRICTSNLTTSLHELDDRMDLSLQTSTETAYIEGATAHCFLQSIGKPVFHAHANTFYGAWMRDAYPRTGLDMDKRWLTNHFEGDILHEFYNEADLRRRKVHKNYKLPHLYKGTNTVFFNGSFYYQRAGTPKIAKFELSTLKYEEVVVDPAAAHKSDNYLFNHSMNYFDLAVDENALWVMFHYETEDFISVAKLDINNLTVYETWNLTMINHTEVANGFVVCGVLYVVESGHNLKSEISIAYDFYRQKYTQPNIQWINLYKNANMMSYNPYDKRIYIYDHGYLLTLPARLNWRAK
ncbi:Gliomedin [Aphelenchoides bicaudatus]|nr:Gliomedin [Aphelenchoides bicaudatus]